MRRFAGIALAVAGVLVLLATLLLGGTGDHASGASAAGQVAGDVNCSGAVDAVDALQVLRSVAGLSTNADCLDTAGDVDCNGDVNSVDALKVLRYVAGLANQYPAGCTPIGVPTVSSDQLIGEALEAGEITEGQATVYRVFAAFGDSRLPQQYRGHPGGLPDSDALLMASISYAQLSLEEQESVSPFLAAPWVPGSWIGLPTVPPLAAVAGAGDWTTFNAAGGKVKVWARNIYPGEIVKAEAVAGAITDTIWPSLIALMGEEHAPLTDAGLLDDGGDGALDVVLVTLPPGTNGLTGPVIKGTGCEMFPARVLLNGNREVGSETSPGIVPTAAHELFHAFQFTYDMATNCWYPEYKWFVEGSATWATDYVYPNAQPEHMYAEDFLKAPGRRLDDDLWILPKHMYGSYLFPFYLTHRYNDPSLMPAIWEAFALDNSLPAIEEVLQPYGGFEARWPEFALYNWNQAPVDYYQQWDGLTHAAATVTGGAEMIRLEGAASRTYSLDAQIDYLTAVYRYLYVADDTVRSVVFDNTLAGMPHATVQALVKTGDAWQPVQDWSDEEEVSFCLDDPDEALDEMVIIISNDDWQGKHKLAPAQQPSLEVSTAPCTRWVGEATMTFHRGGEDWTATGTDLVFEIPESSGSNVTTAFELKSGMLDLDWQATAGCTVSGTFNAPVTQEGNGSLMLIHDALGRRYSASANTYVEGAGSCGGFSYSFGGPLDWLLTGPAYQPAPDADRLTGEYTQEGGGPGNEYTRHYQWDFRAAPAEQGMR